MNREKEVFIRLESENSQLKDGYKVKCDEYNALKLQYDALYGSMARYDKRQLEEVIEQLKAELEAKDEALKAWRKYMTLRNEGKLSETAQIEKVNAYEKACQLTEQLRAELKAKDEIIAYLKADIIKLMEGTP